MTEPFGDSEATAAGGHTPVMLREVLEALAPRDGAIYVDGTFGAGGYASAILDSADCRLWGLDRDPDATRRAAPLVERYSGRLKVILGRFGVMDHLLGERGISEVDGIALDLGLSSMQLDRPERGFSFRLDGPLDMRMGAGGPEAGRRAAEVVQTLSEDELAELIFRYGGERMARRVARAIVAARREGPIERTLRLAEIVRRVTGTAGKAGARRIDPATRTFQALRIYVNDELGELERALRAAERLLAPGGRLAVVAFHSLEDRAVKSFLTDRSGAGPRGSRHFPGAPSSESRSPTFLPLFRGACRPSRAERATNPRARSARLRAAQRTATPTWETDKQDPRHGMRGDHGIRGGAA